MFHSLIHEVTMAPYLHSGRLSQQTIVGFDNWTDHLDVNMQYDHDD